MGSPRVIMTVAISKVLVLAFIFVAVAGAKYKVAKYKNVIEIEGKKSTCTYNIYYTHNTVKLKKKNKKDKATTISCSGGAEGSASAQFEVGKYQFYFESSPAKRAVISEAIVALGPPACSCGRSLVCPVSCAGSCPSTTTKICPLVPNQEAQTTTGPSDTGARAEPRQISPT